MCLITQLVSAVRVKEWRNYLVVLIFHLLLLVVRPIILLLALVWGLHLLLKIIFHLVMLFVGLDFPECLAVSFGLDVRRSRLLWDDIDQWLLSIVVLNWVPHANPLYLLCLILWQSQLHIHAHQITIHLLSFLCNMGYILDSLSDIVTSRRWSIHLSVILGTIIVPVGHIIERLVQFHGGAMIGLLFQLHKLGMWIILHHHHGWVIWSHLAAITTCHGCLVRQFGLNLEQLVEETYQEAIDLVLHKSVRIVCIQTHQGLLELGIKETLQV